MIIVKNVLILLIAKNVKIIKEHVNNVTQKIQINIYLMEIVYPVVMTVII